MNIAGQGALLLLVALYLVGAAATAARLIRARRRGVSIRMQVFLAMAVTTLLLSAVFALIVLENAPRALSGAMNVTELLADIAPEVGLLAFILAGAAAIAAVFIGRAVAKPIERLTRAAERIAAGERQAVLPVPRGREVRALTTAFESMRRELEQRHAMERFVMDLSHEIKNPVASIRAAAEVLEDAIREDPDAARKFGRRISEAADKLEKLTADLLSLARLEAQGLSGPPARVDLAEVVHAAVVALAAQATRRSISVNVSAEKGLWVRGDKEWLQRATENLIANAINHSPENSEVTVSAQARSGAVELTVTDRGSGIDPAVKDRLFERFVTTRHADGGTGLGLAIVQAVAESHGGRAELRSTGTDGSTFVMTIPSD